ncbi:hypothetical protein RFI_14429 [Reticulomyxa filosa]|uniref:Uncharacterized protein n=1 Tax=Reticulomyxa filosa TaxID=46433 RepID=X6NA28_RETFI|nr:hypothetical protein RFI_14429 [Reticulomyxa filosa]|eukprot:ETO22763.1 hypothetical protein RFI_14429 [Reticulomyxa filosa]
MSQQILPSAASDSEKDNPTAHYQELLNNLDFFEPQDLDIAKHWCHIMQWQLFELLVHKTTHCSSMLSKVCREEPKSLSPIKRYLTSSLLSACPLQSRRHEILAQFGTKIPPPLRIRGDMRFHKGAPSDTSHTDSFLQSSIEHPNTQTQTTSKTRKQKVAPADKKKKEKSFWPVRFWKA